MCWHGKEKMSIGNTYNPAYSDERNKHLFREELFSVAERMVTNHKARVRRKRVDEIKFKVF